MLLRAGDDGSVAILCSRNSVDHVAWLSGSETRFLTAPPNERIIDLCFRSDSRLLAANHHGVFDLNEGLATFLNLPSHAPFLFLALEGGRVALIDVFQGKLVTACGAKVNGPFQLVAPEIQTVVRPPDSAIVSAAATNGREIYCKITGHRLQEGAVVLEFSGSGDLRRRFRCELPVSRKHFTGRMRALFIAIVDATLFLFGPEDNLVAYYSLRGRS
ncbi:MAG: hypothetical protein HYR60_07145 [Acidobacteria bacterium]|nr:hypothetical protein [Acidobacteriota bacterium]